MPRRGLGQDEVAGPVQVDTQPATAETLEGVEPQRPEKRGPLPCHAEDVAINGRIFSPTGLVAIEFIGGDAFEHGIGDLCEIGLKPFEKVFLTGEPPADDGQFDDKVPFISIVGLNSIDETFENAFEKVPLGFGHDVITFQPANGRWLKWNDFVRVEAKFFRKRSIGWVKNVVGWCRHNAYSSKILPEIDVPERMPGGG